MEKFVKESFDRLLKIAFERGANSYLISGINEEYKFLEEKSKLFKEKDNWDKTVDKYMKERGLTYEELNARPRGNPYKNIVWDSTGTYFKDNRPER
jgi:hypothetical protein